MAQQRPTVPSAMDDLLLSIGAAIRGSSWARTPSVKGPPEIVLIVPEDNEEIVGILIQTGGELRITLKCAPRPVLELLLEKPAGVSDLDTTSDPNLPGLFFGGGK